MPMPRTLCAATFLTLATAVLACGNSNANGGGGSGGSGSSDCPLPSCYQDFLNAIRACGPSGECVQQSDNTPNLNTQRYCYASGTKETIATSQIDLTFTDTVIAANGASCYTVTGALAVDPSNGAISLGMASFTNSAGQVVATEDAMRILTVTCPGEPPTKLSAACSTSNRPGAMAMPCTMGTCM
jgi:hypothetical protein